MYRKILRRLILGFILSILIFFSHPQFIFAFADPLGSWSNTTNLPINIASHVSAFEGEKVFVFGGANTDDFSEVYSSSINPNGSLTVWNLISNMPETRYWSALAKKDNRVYILGGAMWTGITNYKNTVYSATIQSNGSLSSWQTLTPLPNNRGLGAAVVVGNRIYYAGGRLNDAVTEDEVYVSTINPDGTLGFWSQVGILPEPLEGFGMVEYNNNIIVFGGKNGSVFRDKAYKASVNPDGSLSAFAETSALPEAVYRAGVIRIGSTLVSVGGYNGINALDKIYYTTINSDGTIEPWQLSGNYIPQPVCCGAVAVSGDYVYLTGGHNGASYLNTVYYAPVNVILNVPYYSQNNGVPGGGLWGDQEYDHANFLGFSDPDFERWGCAVTSAAMILNYHGMTEFADGTPIDPGTLNEWLKDEDNDGYSYGGSGANAYSTIIWPVIGSLTQELFDAEKAEYKLTAIPFSSHDVFNEDLELREIAGETVGAPPIIKVTNGGPKKTHYVVPKGFTDTSIAVNDPEWNYLDLANFDNNDYTDLHRYIPSETDLSHLYFVVNPNVELLITDFQGRKTGKIFENGNITIYTEIPGSVYTLESPISNPNSEGEAEEAGTGANIFSLPEPSEEKYQIALSSGENRNYTLNIHTFEEDGAQTHHKIEGFVGAGASDEFDLAYSQNDPSTLAEVVTFDSLINDINALRASGDISSRGVYFSLLAKARVAKGLSGNVWTKRASINLLKSMQKEITKQKGKGVSETAYQILNKDIEALLP